MASNLRATAKEAGLVNEVKISKVPVEINYTGNDDVGKKLVYQIKQMIHKSHSLTITHDKNQPRLKVSIITIDIDNRPKAEQNYTVYSLVISYPWKSFDAFLSQSVGVCGEYKVKEGSEKIVIYIDGQSEYYFRLKEIPNMEKLYDELLDVRNEIRKLQQKSWWEKLWE